MSASTFCTVINCMDGRTQLQVNEYLRRKHGVEHVDTITEPGPVKMLSAGIEADGVGSILSRVDISVHKHGSRAIAIVAHHDCAGNPIEKDVQEKQALESVAFLREKYPECNVAAIWVNEDWKIEEIV